MMSLPHYARWPVVAGVAAIGTMLVLSPRLESPWNAVLLLLPTGVAAQPAPPGRDPAAQRRAGAGAGGHAEHGGKEPPAPTENVMTVSPERLQAVGVKFELAKRRSLDRMIRTVGQVEIDRKSTRLNSSHIQKSRMPSSA